MTPERWRQIEEVYQTLVERDPGERRAYLTQRCGDDVELRREVESLLRHDDFGGFLQAPIEGAARMFASGVERDLIGTRLGPYRLISLIGSGGMGVVYAAVRDDEQFTQQVAVKVVKRGMDTRFVLNRFRYERQILAGLDHPNIARLLDGGATEDGLPYFVMEYIEGQPINEYCASHRLSIPDRVKLFRQVCSAVQYAHQKLIVHRDIKPSNILVNTEGTPKLLDFGIAKLMDVDSSGVSPTQTIAGMRMMTPDYASPEQVRGDRVATATDIYSLGAALYELLSGQRPHRLENYTTSEIEHAICVREPERPSEAAVRTADLSQKARKQIAGDLDNIILMAMRKEPERRYLSVGQLSEDLRRYLAGLPVTARGDTFGYRMGKYLGRHKFSLSATALVLLSLLVGVVIANHQARRAERRFGQVRKLANTFLFEFYDKVQNLPGSTETREMMARTAVEYLDSLAEEAAGDPALLLELSQAYLKVGDVQGDPWAPSLGRTTEAMESYRKSLRIAEQLIEKDPRNVKLERALTNANFKIGALLSETGDKLGGAATLRRAIERGETLSKLTRDFEDIRLVINIYTRVGDTQLDTGDAAQALESYRSAHRLAEELTITHRGDEAQGRLGASYGHLGETMASMGELNGAIENYRRGAVIYETLTASQPNNLRFRRDLRVLYGWLGNLYGNPRFINQGDVKTATRYYELALDISEYLALADPKNARAQLDLASSTSSLGEMLIETNPAAAAELHRKALAVMRPMIETTPEDFSYQRRQGLYLTRLAEAQFFPAERTGSLKTLEEAMSIFDRLAAKDPVNTQIKGDMHETLLAMVRASLIAGDHNRASEFAGKAIALASQSVSSSRGDLSADRRMAEAYTALGRCREARGADRRLSSQQRQEAWREAREAHQKALEIWQAWPKKATGTVFDATRRANAARAVAQCDKGLFSFNE